MIAFNLSYPVKGSISKDNHSEGSGLNVGILEEPNSVRNR